MTRTRHIHLLATYNQWMNTKLYEAASSLSDEALCVDRKAFFGSILGTLNHLVAGDTVWLQRFATHPANYLTLGPIRQLPVQRLDQLLFPDIRKLSAHRVWLDQQIVQWSGSIAESDLDHTLHYTSMKGVPADKNFYGLLTHFFNHQTHHRGQVTTLLSQAGVDIGDTDLVVLIPSEPCALDSASTMM
ncbi:DinB family protein [Pseudomonas sp. RA_35y_Pfl2_P32]|uniref:DinB family protein n=1 Tax=Pseudomonas sp. RA_35y_Pfl2_P32 TaxID=3088705 RepID=UPI0030D8BB90